MQIQVDLNPDPHLPLDEKKTDSDPTVKENRIRIQLSRKPGTYLEINLHPWIQPNENLFSCNIKVNIIDII